MKNSRAAQKLNELVDNPFVRARNDQHATIHWRFTFTDAGIKLQYLYPSISH